MKSLIVLFLLIFFLAFSIFYDHFNNGGKI